MARRLCASLIVLGVIAAASRLALADQSVAAPAAVAPAPAEPAAVAAPVAADGATTPPPRDLGEEQPIARPADLSYGVAARLRWVTVPAFLLNLFTKKNVPLSTWGTGVEVFRRKGDLDIVLALSYQNMSPSDGNWLGSDNDPATQTNFVHFDGLALYGLDASFIWHNHFTDWFGIHYGAGFGIGIVAGHIDRTVIHNAACTDATAGDTSVCKPVAANGDHSMVSGDVPPVVPIINVQAGVDFRVPKLRGWEARLEGGFYDAFYLGGAVGYTF